MPAPTTTIEAPVSINIEQLFLFIYNIITGNTDAINEESLLSFWENFKVFSTIISLLFLTGLVYSLIRMSQLRKEEKKRLYDTARSASSDPKEADKKNERWERVLSHIDSDSTNDWKVAVMEADIMLDDLLTERGYVGETLAEKLKQIDKGQMGMLDSAWEAHKIRNRIAHEGASYTLTQRDARTAIDDFRKVFEEAHYI